MLCYRLLCASTLPPYVCEWLWLPHCPLLVGDHFVTVAVGDQMANWALCHVTSLHWGPGQSAQARLLNCRPHRHHSPILTESSFRGPRGLFRRLTERALLQLIQHQATGLFTFSQPECLENCACMCVLDARPCSLLIKFCQIPCIYDAAIGRHIVRVRFKAKLQMLLPNVDQALCHPAPDWLGLLGITSKVYCTCYKWSQCIKNACIMPDMVMVVVVVLIWLLPY